MSLRFKRLLKGVVLAIAFNQAAIAGTTIEARLNAVHSMKADFVQTIQDNRGKKIQQSFGSMALVRPGKFRWDTKKPIPQLIIANDSRLYIVDKDLEQVTIRALHQATGESPALLLSHENASIEHDYVVKEITKKGSNLSWYSLKPKAEDSPFALVEMGFAGNVLQQMSLQDHLGHSTQIEFKHVQSNIALSNSLFVFKKTANMDVIDETSKRK